jgi:hypothetical protein
MALMRIIILLALGGNPIGGFLKSWTRPPGEETCGESVEFWEIAETRLSLLGQYLRTILLRVGGGSLILLESLGLKEHDTEMITTR